jgi:hypothetical protein
VSLAAKRQTVALLTWENGVDKTTIAPNQEGTCSVRSSHSPDAITVCFDDDHAVADAGLILAATLAEGLMLGELVNEHVDLGGAPGAANAGEKAMTLIHSALAGGEWIDDADRLRAGSTGQALGLFIMARRIRSRYSFGRSGRVRYRLPLCQR